MKCSLLREMPHAASRKMLPVGHVIDDPQAFRLVQMGVALPADDECRERCKMTPEQMAAAKAAYEATDRGIHPEDREAFAKGWMTGYRRSDEAPQRDLLGNTSNIWERGPQWAEYAALLQAEVDAHVDDPDEVSDAEGDPAAGE